MPSHKQTSSAPMQKYREAHGIEKQLQFDAREQALKRWDEAKKDLTKKKAKSA